MNQPQTTPWSDRLRRARKLLDLDQEAFGKRLGVSREWISKIESGKQPVSELVRIKLEAIEREIDRGTLPAVAAYEREPVGAVEEAQSPRDTIPHLSLVRHMARARIQDHIDELLAKAGDDIDRLGWIVTQLKTSVKMPPDWISDEELNAEADVIAKKLNDEREARLVQKAFKEARREISGS